MMDVRQLDDGSDLIATPYTIAQRDRVNARVDAHKAIGQGVPSPGIETTPCGREAEKHGRI